MVTYNDLGKYDAARQIYSQIRHRGAGGLAKADPFAKGKIANMHAEISQAYLDAGMIPEAVASWNGRWRCAPALPTCAPSSRSCTATRINPYGRASSSKPRVTPTPTMARRACCSG